MSAIGHISSPFNSGTNHALRQYHTRDGGTTALGLYRTSHRGRVGRQPRTLEISTGHRVGRYR
eukprot:3485152-Rhodomonas_salina.1